MAQKNSNLNTAKSTKNDEFYTKLADIEQELEHYKGHFKDKVVYCNCDAEWSNFWVYFRDNFVELGLKKLYATYYEKEKQAFKLEYDGNEVIRTALQGDGDFRSVECVSILKEADIVCSNPPFSMFRLYIALLMKYKKKFLVIGSQNAITYKEIFPLLRENEMWLGVNPVKEFIKPDGAVQKFGNICWFTNMDINKRHTQLELTKLYDPAKYPKYDNYDVIECNRVADIPADYFPCWYFCDKADVCAYAKQKGVGECTTCCAGKESCNGIIGVPITFLDRLNPEQFEILGISNSARWIGHECYTVINGQRIYNRILIRNKCNGVI